MDPLDAWVLVRLPLGIVLGGIALWVFRPQIDPVFPQADPGWLQPIIIGLVVGALAAWYLGGWIVRELINANRAAKVVAAEMYLEELVKAASEGRYDLGAVMDERATREKAPYPLEEIQAPMLWHPRNPGDALDEWISDDAGRSAPKDRE